MRFINTRPRNRAAALTQALTDAGYQVESLPLLELVAEPFDQTLQQLYQQLTQAQVIVVVSPSAVEIGMTYLQQAGIELGQLQHIQWIAVGQATAQALTKFKINSHVPEIENSEGMLELPILKQFQQIHTIAFWRGLGGRQFMMQQLQQQGMTILNFVLYQRYCPESTTIKFPQLLKKMPMGQTIAVLISSEASWNYWQQLCQQHSSSRQIEWIYLVLGERLRQRLANTQIPMGKVLNMIQLENLSASAMIQCLSDWQGKL